MKIIDLNSDDEEELVMQSIEAARKSIGDDDIDVVDFSDFESKDSDDEETTSLGREIISLIINVAVCFVIVFLITTFLGQRTVVSGSSMEDTLSDGDNLIVDKLSYRIGEPERFDVVVFPYQYEEDTFYIKRIIGLPGETVSINGDGEIFINGELIEDPYGTEPILNAGLAAQEIILTSDEYFVLGDNRNNSTDSRFESVGNVKGSDFVGRAWVRLYPFNEIGLVENIE